MREVSTTRYVVCSRSLRLGSITTAPRRYQTVARTRFVEPVATRYAVDLPTVPGRTVSLSAAPTVTPRRTFLARATGVVP